MQPHFKMVKDSVQTVSIKSHFGRAIHNRSLFSSLSLSLHPHVQPLYLNYFDSHLFSELFIMIRHYLVHIYPQTNLDYLKYPTYNFPPLCSIPFDSRLTHMAPGPIGVRLWGALKPARLIPFHHLTREALKPQGQLLPFFQTTQCGLANSQSESCLHSVTDNALASCQPIISLHTWWWLWGRVGG